MSTETQLVAESRTEFGKGAARRIRRTAKVPAVLYGHGSDPVHVTLPAHDTLMALKHGGANALLSIVLDGKAQLALPKQIQKDPVKGELEHVDLLIVKRGEKVTVEVPIVATGDPQPGTLVSIEHNTVSLEVEATHIPEHIEVDVQGAEAGLQVHARDIELPTGATLHLDGDVLVVHVTETPSAAAVEAALEAAEAEAGIVHEAPAAEAAPAE